MGMDVVGLKPKNKTGEYFRANVWYWHPLWSYCEYAHPTIASKVEHAHSNDGGGLNSRDSITLARLLKKDIESGSLQKFIDDYQKELDALPLEDCKYCDEDGNRTWDENGLTVVKQCNVCSGSKKVEQFSTWYKMDFELMKEFQQFLENCGGFQIW